MALQYAWYADDFTGASDTLATLAAAGKRALLFLGAPTPEQRRAAGPLDALGIAGLARALDPMAMRAELAPVARCFAELAPAITHYKCCSTFDSAVDVGNLATGVAALRRPDHGNVLTVVGGQPSLGRYCAFGELYATAQAGGEVHRIDRHPTMSRHPVTPMLEADLRRHLASLGIAHTGLVDLRALDAAATGDGLLDATVDEALKGEPQALLFDACRERHLQLIGHWLWQRSADRPQLVLGASSVAQAALAHWPGDPAAPVQAHAAAVSDSPVFLLVGSQSPVTAAQAGHAQGRYQELAIDPRSLVNGAGALEKLARRCAEVLQRGQPVMARISAAGSDSLPPLLTAQLCAELLVRVLALSPQVRRVGLAGGDTSSVAMRALGAWALQWAGSIASGVALTRVRSDDPALDGIEVMLKGGQMGSPDLFLRLLDGAR